MKRIFCVVLASLCFSGVALAQTTSSGGHTAGNKPGTNMTGSYHRDNAGGKSTTSGSVNGHAGSRTSTGNGTPNANTGK
jgi:hypothetical protein